MEPSKYVASPLQYQNFCQGVERNFCMVKMRRYRKTKTLTLGRETSGSYIVDEGGQLALPLGMSEMESDLGIPFRPKIDLHARG